jgi:hypothetical protein
MNKKKRKKKLIKIFVKLNFGKIRKKNDVMNVFASAVEANVTMLKGGGGGDTQTHRQFLSLFPSAVVFFFCFPRAQRIGKQNNLQYKSNQTKKTSSLSFI